MLIGDLLRTFLSTKKHLLRIFAIYGFVINQDIVIFSQWAAVRLVVGSGGQK